MSHSMFFFVKKNTICIFLCDRVIPDSVRVLLVLFWVFSILLLQRSTHLGFSPTSVFFYICRYSVFFIDINGNTNEIRKSSF